MTQCLRQYGERVSQAPGRALIRSGMGGVAGGYVGLMYGRHASAVDSNGRHSCIRVIARLGLLSGWSRGATKEMQRSHDRALSSIRASGRARPLINGYVCVCVCVRRERWRGGGDRIQNRNAKYFQLFPIPVMYGHR